MSIVKRSAFAALIALALAGPALADDWDAMDKGMSAALIASTIADCLQTLSIFGNPEQYEINGFINEGVGRYGEGFIPVYFAATTLIAMLVADMLPSGHRKGWLGIWVGASVTTVYRNHVIGIKFSF